MDRRSTVAHKSYELAVLIARAYLRVKHEHNEFYLSSQIVRSGTSIGANIQEAQSAYS